MKQTLFEVTSTRVTWLFGIQETSNFKPSEF
jgi:hypothetical protein